MRARRSVLGGLGLVGLGAAAALASNLHVSWGPAASASPGAAVPAAEVRAALPPPSAAQVADARSLSRTFAQVAAQLSPSVVRISITKTVRGAHLQGNPFQGTPFERFFGFDEEGPSEGPKQQGMGSGVVIDAKGYILTNNHVVEGADEVKVSFLDGKTVAGKVVGTDPRTDLAVVKVDKVAVKPARFGDSDKLQVGEWMIAIGNPFGLDHTVTVGVLSAKNRSGFHSNHYEDFLQTDASINPGNSGGPLVSLEGEVMGINTMIRGIGTGIGFAVPSSMARPITEQLIRGGKVRRPYLGILMQDVTPDLQKSLGGKAPDKGALVGQVQSGSPADKAGVRPGDVITRVDGKMVDGSRAVQRNILGKSIGQKVELAVWRDGKETRVSPTTGEMPGDEEQARATHGQGGDSGAKLGLGLQSLTPQLNERLGLNKGARGAVVSAVRPGSPAHEAGVREGDVLLEVDRRPVSSAADAARALSAQRPGGHLLRIKRGDGALFVVIPTA